ncbi:MAG TPA: GMC family oxidoreductase [Bryobacteraceae bacterium]|nr:GMC family oxidoreductase [Bryobacteraceae bacterium]
MVKYSPNTQVDFLVIGSGISGGIMAKELSGAGFSVVVLEKGDWLHESDFQYDQLKHTSRGSIMATTSPATFRQTEDEKAMPTSAFHYGSCVGGGTVHYSGSSWRHHASDFKEKSIFGPVAGSGFDDWPVTYEELEPYYTRVEWEIGYSGLGGASPFESPRSKGYPLPPMPNKSSGVLMERAAKKLGLHAVPVPVAMLSQAYRGRSGCIHCGYCSGYGCKVAAKSSSLSAIIPGLERGNKCEIRSNSYAREISVDGQGRVTGAVYFDPNKKEVFQRAKVVIVSCNGLESPRLLLMSKSSRFPQGLANSNGVVGRYFVPGCGASAHGVFEHELNEYKSVTTTRGVEDFYMADPKRGYYGGGRMDARGNMAPVGFALGGLSPDVPRWGTDFKKAVRQDFSRTLTVQGFLTCLPVESNRIDLDPELKDPWGLPAMRVTYKDHPDNMKNKEFFTQKALEIVEAAGATRKWASPVRDERAAGHMMGSCRMGNDPKTSVVDRWHKAHDVPNLYVVDGSSFVTSARNHPTCTISALAFRAAEHIVKSAKNGSIKSAV